MTSTIKRKAEAPSATVTRKNLMVKTPEVNTNIQAEHTSAKSGYRADVLNDDADARAGVSIPKAAWSGKQQGRLSPAERQYGVANYEVLTSEEAGARMAKRLKGELPPIRGGVDDPMPLGAKVAHDEGINDPWPDAPDSAGYDGMTPVPSGQTPGGAQRQAPLSSVKGILDGLDYQPPTVTQRSAADQYLKKRTRVSMELTDSTMNLSAIDVIVSRLGVTVLLPVSPDGGTVVPKPGSEATIVVGDKSYGVYFPGGQFEIEPLGLLGLSFIRKEE